MRLNLLNISILLIITACSSQISKEDVETKKDLHEEVSPGDQKKASEHFINGSMAELKGNYAEAILEYQDALKLDPSSGIHFALSKGYLRLNKLSSALEHAYDAVELSSENIEYNMLLAQVYSSARQKDSAASVYENIISLDTLNTQAYFNLGQIYETDKPLRALEIYNRLLIITGPEWNVLLKIADLNERLGNVEETVRTVEYLLALNPSSLELQKLLIESYIKTAKYNEALNLVDDALTLFPEDYKLIEYKGNVYLYQENWEKAAFEYNKIIKNIDIPFENKIRIASAFVSQADKDSTILPIAKNMLTEVDADSSDWQVKIFLGEIALQENNDSLAIKYFTDASNLAAWNIQIWMRLGGLLFDSQMYEDAIIEMEKAIPNFPDEYVINVILGLSHSQLGQSEKAESYLEKSVQLRPNDLTALSAYGFTLNQLGQQDHAISILNKALNIDPNNVQILGILGLIYDSKKLYDKCDMTYEKALAIDSANALVLNNYAYSLAERGIRLEEALIMSQTAVNKDPDNASYLDTIGWIYYRLDDYENAKKYIEKAIEHDDDNGVVIDHLGDIYYKSGKIDKALELWNRAFELDSSIEGIENKINRGTL